MDAQTKEGNSSEPASKRQKSDRLRKEPAWFGNREGNDDDLFREIPKQTESNDQIDSAATVLQHAGLAMTTNESNLSVLTPGEKIIFEQFLLLKKQVTVLQRAMVGMEVRLDERLPRGSASAIEATDFKKINADELQAFGLPITNEVELTDLEKKLKQKDFFAQVVRVLKLNIY